MGQNRIMIGLLLATAMIAAQRAGAGTAENYARRGNELYQNQRFQEAADAYRQALSLNPSSSLFQYNLGTALAEQRNYDDARRVLEQAAEAPGSAKRVDALFNTGVAMTRAGQEKSATAGAPGAAGPAAGAPGGGGTEAQIEAYNQALQAFRQTILTDPNDVAAKYNYEYVMELLRQAREQQQQQQQQQQQKQQQQNQDGQQQDQQQQNKQNEQQQNQDQQQQQSGDPKDQQSQGNNPKQDQGLEKPQNQPKPQPTPGGTPKPNNQPQGSGGSGDSAGKEPLTPEQMDAQRILNMLEEENPEQFKRLFRFQGERGSHELDKDW